MHSSVYTFIPASGDRDGLVERAMEPFDEANPVAPYKIYLNPDEIDAMAKNHKLKSTDLLKLGTLMESWCSNPGGVDDRGLYRISTFNPGGHWDWYEIGGRWNGVLPNNETVAHSLLDRADLSEILPASFIDQNGLWHEQETFVASSWPRGKFVAKSDREWLDEFRAELNASPDSRIVCVDMHS